MAAGGEGVLMEEDVITLRVERYRPDDAGPFYQEYRVPYRSDTVVLDALNYVKDHVDGTLTYRWSCRMGICGSCGATVNGVPRLTCETFLKDFKGVVTVGPLEHFPVVKDLVVDISDFLGKLRSVQPWIVRGDINDTSKGEYPQAPWELELYRQQSLCINCMICYSACPVYGHDPRFLGPAAAALAYRYIMDSRDHGRGERLRATMAHDGIYECTFVGECSHVCPKDVDPAAAIQRLKAQGALSLLMPKGGR
jgi:fumarate reductase iron-sulfur subunit